MNAIDIRCPGQERNTALDHLRAAITVLVVAHHAVLAYHPYAPPLGTFGASDLSWAAFPVVDPRRWAGIDVFVGFNDTFFMSLMFFLSGLFAWHGLKHKRAAGFLRDRALRLGLPFLASVVAFAPLAYVPAWLQRGGTGGPAGFLQAWSSLGVWPAGPAWFLWVLLAFDVLVALAWRMMPGRVEALGRSIAGRTPVVFFAWLATIGAIAFVPLAWIVDPSGWSSCGPFSVQTSRILLYAAFFATGVATGAWGIERGVLAAHGALGRRWALWANVAAVAYFLLVALFITLLVTNAKQQPIPGLETATLAAFAASCAATSFAFLALFLRFARRRGALSASLVRNAYGIYLVHYVGVTWLQFALLGVNWPGAAKGMVVFLGALILSWATVSAVRGVPAVARVL